MYALGIDLGTSKIAGVLLSVNSGELREEISEPNSADIRAAHSWERLQEPAQIIRIASRMIAALKQSADGPVVSLGISGQMHGFLYVDEQGQALGPLYTWQDGRAGLPLGAGACTAQSLIEAKTGCKIFCGYALATHYYNQLRGLQPQVPHKLVSIGGYLGMQLCSESSARIDPSEAASFGLYDQERAAFRVSDIIALWGQARFLPEVVPFAYQLGCDRDGTAVFQSLGDNQASFYGSSAMKEGASQGGQLLINLGTGAQVSLLLRERENGNTGGEENWQGLERRPYPGAALLVGATLAGGKSFALLADFFGEVLAFFGIERGQEEIYRMMEQWQETLTGQQWDRSVLSSGPMASGDGWVLDREQLLSVEPYFYGTRGNPDLSGAISRIRASNLRPQYLIYGFAEAIVRELWELLCEHAGRELPTTIMGSGNGIRRNPLIRRIIEEVFGAELVVPDLREEAACGAAWYGWRAWRDRNKASGAEEAE